MTDKQIIDSIDVSGCEYYNKINKHTGQYCICELEPNCLYKQLKRKEQECDNLNADNIYLKDRVGKLERAILRRNDKLDQLKQTEQKLEKIKDYCKEQNLKADWTACEILEMIEE